MFSLYALKDYIPEMQIFYNDNRSRSPLGLYHIINNEMIVLHPYLQETGSYLLTNSPYMYLQKRNENTNLRFVPYWTNVWGWPPQIINTDNICIDFLWIFSHGILQTKEDINSDIINELKNTFKHLYVDVSRFTTKNAFKINLQKLEGIEIIDNYSRNTLYDNYIIPYINDNYWSILDIFTSANYTKTNFIYQYTNDFVNTFITFLFNLFENDIEIEQVSTNFQKVSFDWSNRENIYMKCFMKTINQVKNIVEDNFESCNNYNEIINYIKEV